MSRGPTRRVRHMIDNGEISSDVIRAADHEADLLGHPYIGLEHVRLARLRLAGDVSGRDRQLATLAGDVSGRDRQLATLAGEVGHRWWQIRGRRSALRRAGRAQTDAARRAAEARARSQPDG